jgi:tRNA dimethylallyltransferase
MMDKGLLEEVKGLLSKYPPEIKAFQALGYKQMIAHLRGDISLEEAVAQIKRIPGVLPSAK